MVATSIRRYGVIARVDDVGGFAIRSDRDPMRGVIDRDGGTGGVGGHVYRQHRVAVEIGDIDGRAIRGDRDHVWHAADPDAGAGSACGEIDRHD